MAVFLIIAGCTWFGLGAIFVLSLMCVARRGIPSPTEQRLPDMKPAMTQCSAPKLTESQMFTVEETDAPRLVEEEVAT